MNRLMITVTAVLCLFARAEFAGAQFFDDFETDTSANYTFSDSYGSGGSFDVSGGTLNVMAVGGNTAAAMTTDAVSLKVGDSVSVDMPPRGGDMFLCVSTVAAQPNGTSSFGMRFRRDTNGLRMHLYPGGQLDAIAEPDADQGMTVRFERTADTEFAAYYQLPNDPTPTLVDEFTLVELAGITQLHVGVQAWAVPVSFDNLRVISPGFSHSPSPADALEDVPRDVELTWAAGDFAVKHNVYLGTGFDDVNDAGEDSNLMVSQGQSDASYDAGILEFGQTYFWRVDEVNGAPDHTVFKGDVWRFTVEAYAIPVKAITATASSSNAEDMGPEKTIDGIGLNELDQHSTESTEMWLSGVGDSNPSIQYTFDKAYKLHELWVWNSNQTIESFIGIGAKDVVIETSLDGAAWTVLEGATLFNQATGSTDYTANTRIDFAGVMAQYVKITITAGYGMLPQYGLSEVRFLYIPTFAREPMPADGDTTAGANVVLGWRAGREAASHQVYLGTDAADLALVATTDAPSSLAEGLDYDQSYYWQVIEVNEAKAPSAYAGPVWGLTTPPYGTVDNFNQYDDDCNRIFFAWLDGLGHNGGEEIDDCDVAAYNGNGTGSIVGHATAPFAEQSIANAGQSMPLVYDNTLGTSEATLALAGQDWTASGVQTLSLLFYGQPDNTGQLYVKINNSKVVYDGEAADITRAQWVAWNIDLTALSGLQNVSALTIGVDGASARGLLYIDDIRLFPKRDEPGDVEFSFLDDFETDTSVNYTYSDSYGSGGSFDVSGGTLNINAAGGNTATAMTSELVDFGVGQTVSVDVPVTKSGDFLLISTVPAQPQASNGEYGIRLRRSGSQMRVDGKTEYIAAPESPMTFLVERTSDTGFAAYYQLLGESPTLIGEFTVAELSGINQVHIGVQAWAEPFSFDNLRVTQR